MDGSIESLLSFVPRRLALRGLENQSFDEADEFDCAILFADISGFTDLVDRLSRRGTEGIEALTVALASFFQAMLDTVAEHGGDVQKMRGDALVVAWELSATVTADEAVLRAAACAIALQEAAQGFSTPDGAKMSVRVGLGVGHLRVITPGSANERREYLPLGEPLVQMGYAQGRANPGEIVASPQAWGALQTNAEGAPLDEGYVRLSRLRTHPPLQRNVALPIDKFQRETLELFASNPVRFVVGTAGEQWLADVRQIAVLFVALRAEPTGPDIEAKLVRISIEAQKAAGRFEGANLGWGVDEKGASLICVFGLPPRSHEDDAYRAVQAAEAIRDAIQPLGFAAGFGLASGRAYCGILGSSTRRDYAVTGTIVNVAARLAHQSPGEIFCDQATYYACSNRIQFSVLPPLRLKGIAAPVAVFVPGESLTAAPRTASPMIGHKSAYERTVRGISDVKGGLPFAALLEGEAGMGKSTLLQQWIMDATSQDVRVLTGATESIHASTPYFTWRAILEQLLELPSGGGPSARIARIVEKSRGTEWEQQAPLLSDILDLGFEDTPLTRQLSGKIRADNTRDLVINLVSQEAARQPLALVFEDCHWMDSASLALAIAIVETGRPIASIFSLRPVPTGCLPGLDALAGRTGVAKILLGSLTPEECVALAAQRLAVRRIAPSVADLIATKSQGNPFFAIEIAFALREGALVLIEGDECRQVAGIDLSSVKFPDNVQGIITRRVDSLDPSVQLAAKVASVVGRTFSVPLVREPFPVESERPQVEDYIHRLQDERLILAETPASFAFAHALVEEAIYDRMLASQRKPLHEAVAHAIEHENGDDLEPVAAILGHHWHKAGDDTRAGHYFGLAGKRAVGRGAYQEGLLLLDKALSLTPPPDSPKDVLRLGQWQRMRAESLLGLGKLEESGKAFYECARVLGRPVATEAKANVTQHVMRRFGRWILHNKRRASDPIERERLRELASCYEMLSLINLFGNRMTESLSAALETLEHAEPLGDEPEYARALATMALATSLVPARTMANRYAAKAVQVAQKLGEEMTSSRVGELTCMYFMGAGRWNDAEAGFSRAIEGFRLVGDKRRQIECTCLLSTWHHYRGDFRRRVELGQEVFRLALSSGDLQAQAWGLLDQIESFLNLGEFNQVRSLGEALRRHIGQNIYGADDIMAYGLLAALEHRTGRFEEAVTCADKALAIMTAVSPTIVYNLEAYAAVADVYLTGWAQSTGTPQEAKFREKATKAATCVREFGRIFRIGEARALLVTAREMSLCGDAPQALKLTRRSLAVATEIDMPYEKALAHRQLARLLPTGDERRIRELDVAIETFRRVAAAYDVRVSQSLMPASA